jgi:hypothetical protein
MSIQREKQCVECGQPIAYHLGWRHKHTHSAVNPVGNHNESIAELAGLLKQSYDASYPANAPNTDVLLLAINIIEKAREGLDTRNHTISFEEDHSGSRLELKYEVSDEAHLFVDMFNDGSAGIWYSWSDKGRVDIDLQKHVGKDLGSIAVELIADLENASERPFLKITEVGDDNLFMSPITEDIYDFILKLTKPAYQGKRFLLEVVQETYLSYHDMEEADD